MVILILLFFLKVLQKIREIDNFEYFAIFQMEEARRLEEEYDEKLRIERQKQEEEERERAREERIKIREQMKEAKILKQVERESRRESRYDKVSHRQYTIQYNKCYDITITPSEFIFCENFMLGMSPVILFPSYN